jgi:hypothetical protein
VPIKQTPEELLKKHLGQEDADALLKKIDKMVADGESAAKIEDAAHDDIAAHIEKQVISALAVKFGPADQIKVSHLNVSVVAEIKRGIAVHNSTVKVNSVKVNLSGVKVNSSMKLTLPR